MRLAKLHYALTVKICSQFSYTCRVSACLLAVGLEPDLPADGPTLRHSFRQH